MRVVTLLLCLAVAGCGSSVNSTEHPIEENGLHVSILEIREQSDSPIVAVLVENRSNTRVVRVDYPTNPYTIQVRDELGNNLSDTASAHATNPLEYPLPPGNLCLRAYPMIMPPKTAKKVTITCPPLFAGGRTLHFTVPLNPQTISIRQSGVEIPVKFLYARSDIAQVYHKLNPPQRPQSQ